MNGAPREVLAAAEILLRDQRDDKIRELFRRWRGHPSIRWKDSIKKVLGLERPMEKGLDL
jgi:hypothetical protein